MSKKIETKPELKTEPQHTKWKAVKGGVRTCRRIAKIAETLESGMANSISEPFDLVIEGASLITGGAFDVNNEKHDITIKEFNDLVHDFLALSQER